MIGSQGRNLHEAGRGVQLRGAMCARWPSHLRRDIQHNCHDARLRSLTLFFAPSKMGIESMVSLLFTIFPGQERRDNNRDELTDSSINSLPSTMRMFIHSPIRRRILRDRTRRPLTLTFLKLFATMANTTPPQISILISLVLRKLMN